MPGNYDQSRSRELVQRCSGCYMDRSRWLSGYFWGLQSQFQHCRLVDGSSGSHWDRVSGRRYHTVLIQVWSIQNAFQQILEFPVWIWMLRDYQRWTFQTQKYGSRGHSQHCLPWQCSHCRWRDMKNPGFWNDWNGGHRPSGNRRFGIVDHGDSARMTMRIWVPCLYGFGCSSWAESEGCQMGCRGSSWPDSPD